MIVARPLGKEWLIHRNTGPVMAKPFGKGILQMKIYNSSAKIVVRNGALPEAISVGKNT